MIPNDKDELKNALTELLVSAAGLAGAETIQEMLKAKRATMLLLTAPDGLDGAMRIARKKERIFNAKLAHFKTLIELD